MSAQPRITKAGFHALDPLAYRDLEALHRTHLQSESDQDALLNDPQYTSVNVASIFNGAVGAATSTIAPYSINGALVGDRRGIGWIGGLGYTGWADNSLGAFPDTFTSTFAAPCIISRVDLATAQDSILTTANEITPATTFTLYGLTSYALDYQDGAGAWQNIATITGNDLVWRYFTFSPVLAKAVRCVCNASVDGYSRITSLEAWLAK